MKRTIRAFWESMETEDEQSHAYFMELDAILCQMEKWPKQKKELDLIRKEYGEVYDFFRDFWQVLQMASEQRRMFRDELGMLI